ncbi:190_t:CDS:1, partial [Entrophospora sp. SA101]
METLRRFAYKIIFCEIPSSIPSDISQSFENILSINPDEPNICPVCQIEISSQLTEPITILTCKHIFHHNCIDNHQLHCPICEKVNNEFSQTFIVANTLGDNLQINSAESSEKSQGSSVESASEEPAEEESSDESSNETDSKRSPRITRRQKKIQGLIMELSTPTRAIVEISSDGEQSLSNTETTNPTALDLARLFQKAIQTEKDATRGNQKEILSWYRFGELHENKVRYILANEHVTDKTARSRVYKEVSSHLPNVTADNLRKKTYKARNIYRLFNDIGVDKINLIKSYSADSISRLSIPQIKAIINHFSDHS